MNEQLSLLESDKATGKRWIAHMREILGGRGMPRMHNEYVVCIHWQGETFRGCPMRDENDAKDLARKCPGWVETVRIYD